MRPTPVLLALFSTLLPLSAGVNFIVDFEPGSKWFTETWSAAARTEMQAYFTDLGALFDSEAEVRVSITDNATTAYASAGSSWYQYHAHPESGGLISAPGLWLIIVKGIHNPAATSDVGINWNLDVNALHGGNSGALINNIRGLARHEMHHAFGSVSWLYHEEGYDTRGTSITGSLIDTLYRDQNGAPVLGTVTNGGLKYTVNHFPLAADWATASNQSGLYFEGRDIQGRVVKMPPISGGGSIDFSHVTGISYANDHPSWRFYENTDFNFLRALGYPLMIDSQLRQQAATVTAFDFSGTTASLTSLSTTTRHYRLATSEDLRHWTVMPVGKPGTGSPLGFIHPINRAGEPKRFFQVVEVPE